MNATELFLNLPAADSSAVGKTEGSGRAGTQGTNMFQATFAKTLKTHLSLSQSGTRSGQPYDAVQKPPIGNSNFTQTQSAADPDTTPADRAACARAKADAYRVNSPTARTAKETPSQDDTAADSAAAPQNAAQQTQASSSASDAQGTAAEEIRAIADELERIADSGELTATDEQMQQLLLNLMALLLSGKDNSEALKELASALGIEDISQLEGLKLTFFVDKDSELFQQLSALMDSNDLDPGILEQMKLLVRLNDEQAIEIDIAGLIEGMQAAEDGAADGNTLSVSFGDSENGDSAAITLNLTPEAVSNAKLVDISANQAAQAGDEAADVALLVPAGLLEEAQALKATADPNAQAALQLQQADGPEQPQAIIQLVQPAADAQQAADDTATATTNAQFLQSDEFLKKMELESTLKEMTAAKQARFDVAERLNKLLASTQPAESFSVLMLDAKNGESAFVQDLFDQFAGQQDTSGQKQWSASLLKDNLPAEMLSDSRSSMTAQFDSSRISFLGRNGDSVSTAFNQALNQAAETSRPTSSAQTYQSVVDQVVSRIQYSSLGQNGGEVRVFIRPEHLGDLTLKVRVENDVVVAKFIAHSSEVKGIIESSLNQLRDALAEAGVKAGKIVVTLGDGQQQQQQQPETNANRQDASAAYIDVNAPASEETSAAIGETAIADGLIYSTRQSIQTAASSRHSYLA